MYDKEIAQRMEGEIKDLFGESTCQLECKPCQGKYLGHDRYTLVFHYLHRWPELPVQLAGFFAPYALLPCASV